MKTFLFILFVVGFGFLMTYTGGCTGVALQPDADCRLISALAREVCIELAVHRSDVVKYGKQIAEEFLSLPEGEKGIGILKSFIENLVAVRTDNPHLSRCIKDLLDMIIVEEPLIPAEQLPQIRAVMQGFLDGATLTKEGGEVNG